MVLAMEPDAQPIPGYRLTRYLGRGGFGEVWEAEAPGGLLKAIKQVPMDLSQDAYESREIEGLQKVKAIRHPYLLSIERFEVVDGNLIIVMELADENLADRYDYYVGQDLPGIPREELLRYIREAAEVLDVMCEKHGLQHLDIKPENLFLSGGHVKVADFGLVQPKSSSMHRTAVAISPPYAPPELFDGRVEPTADQYSLAVAYQELLTGTRPYMANDIRGLVYLHLRGKPDLSAVPVSDRPALARAYQRDPKLRFGSCRQFVEALSRAIVFGTPMMEARPAEEASAAGPSRTPVLTEEPPAPHFTPRQPSLTPKPAPTALPPADKRADVAETPPAVRWADADEDLRSTFVAFLPLPIFAHKLRGFIDVLGAEMVTCDEDRTVLLFAMRGWLGRKSQKGIFFQIDTFCPTINSDYRVVEASAWSTNPNVQGRELARRFLLLLQYLKAYMMATDKPIKLRSAKELREEIAG